jgi:hypothetical protein
MYPDKLTNVWGYADAAEIESGTMVIEVCKSSPVFGRRVETLVAHD